jgi:hypothetical protein
VQPGGTPRVARIEIPLFQRDYAQGRHDPQATEIRVNFTEALLEAIAGGEPVGLDFIYGKIEGETFRPLDGQQRLTTLFLLHWYLASAASRLVPGAAWTSFSYATRPGARMFCERLATHAMPQDAGTPSAWITDQPWYLYVWEDDPTIQSMLVMIDEIHNGIQRIHPELDTLAAWERLTGPESPAVSFYLLPLEDMDSDADLYIKMNSRGKPLTSFENFKARFEHDIRHSPRAGEFARKIDGAWSDLLWPYHRGDNIVDYEFIRYLEFITELCELREGRVASGGHLGPRAQALFGEANERAEEHLDFLFGAFDCWQDASQVASTFSSVLSKALPGRDQYDPQKVVLFGSGGINLFEHCLRGLPSFGLQETLLLYAFLIHLIEDTADFPRRLRILRNLITASEDEVRRNNMPTLVGDVNKIIVNGDLDAVSGFAGNQLEDERRKRRFLDASPELADALFRLEDHPILRGTLSGFEFSSQTFRQRAEGFEAVFRSPEHWLGLTGALLATGDYQRQRPKSEAWQFGTSSPDNSVWRYLLTRTTYARLSSTRTVLGRLLDGLAGAGSEGGEYFEAVTQGWLSERENAAVFDWRYHLVRYPAMRSGATGIYYGVDGKLGYSMCMLRTQQRNGKYRDPILLGVWETSGVGARVEDPWFTGYETNPRWMRLAGSWVGMRSIDDGFALEGPEDKALYPQFTGICRQYGAAQSADAGIVLKVPQHDHGDGPVDTADRVVIGAAFLRALVEAGL